MTPEQIEQSAQYIVMQYYRDGVQVQEIVALVRAAVEAEREACSWVAYRYGCIDARDAIRARTKV